MTPDNIAGESFLTVAQAAEKLQVHERTMRRYLAKGTVRGVKLGRDWRVPVSAFAELAAGRVAPAAPVAGTTPPRKKAAAKRTRRTK